MLSTQVKVHINNIIQVTHFLENPNLIFTDLTYKDLDVQNGTEAILVYGMLPQLTDEEYKNKYQALRVYCRQDTWSMVKILQGLKDMIK